MSVDRREFLEAAALLIAGLGAAACQVGSSDAAAGVDWKKGVCRFCGTGCGVLVGVRRGRVVAVQGDPQNPVNRGLLCVKGYHVPLALYGADRLTRPQIRKGARLVEATWDEALDLVARKFAEAAKAGGPEAVAIYGSGQWTRAPRRAACPDALGATELRDAHRGREIAA